MVPDRAVMLARRVLEVIGFGLLGVAGWLIHPSLGLLVAGVAALNWAYGVR